MKQLLNGVAIAAVFALVSPAFAQNAPMTPPKAAAPAPAPKPMATKPMMHHAVKHHMMSKDDMMTEQLNKAELARIMGGMPPAAAPAPAPAAAAPPPPPK